MKPGIERFLKALAENMPQMTHRTKAKKKGVYLAMNFPDMKDDLDKPIDKAQMYLCDIEQPVDSLRLLRGLYAKTTGNKEKACVEAVFAAKKTVTEKFAHKTLDGDIIHSATIIK